MSLRNLGRTGDVGALADVDEGNVGGERKRLEAGEAQHRLVRRRLTRRDAFDRLGDGADMLRRRAAAAADKVDEPVAREAADGGGHLIGGLVIEAEGVGQAGVGIGAGERVGGAGDFFEVLAHRLGAQRAVEPDGERPRMAHRMPERRRRLPGKRAARTVGDGARNHQRRADAALLEDFAGRRKSPPWR